MFRIHLPIIVLALSMGGACSDDAGRGPADPSAPDKDDVRTLAGKADDGTDWCQQYGWYGDGECDTFCAKPDPDCAAPSGERTPELGDDPSVALDSTMWLSDALAQSERANGPTIEAKFELGDDGKLSLSVYPAGNGVAKDAERNLFEELAGDPTGASWTPGLEVFHDQEHLTRSARDLTLVQLSRKRLIDVVADAEWDGFVYWAVPTIKEGRAGFGLYSLIDDGAGVKSVYRFVDGGGSATRQVKDFGKGPGSGATDSRVPELGGDVRVVRQARISMADAIARVEREHGPVIEAKYELGDDGKLSLSVYPIGKDLATSAEGQSFFELAGDPTAAQWTLDKSEFAAPDEEHLTRSARDLTIVQTASLTLYEAVKKAEAKVRGGFVYWAIPTLRGTRAGYGIYVLGKDDKVHYLFVS